MTTIELIEVGEPTTTLWLPLFATLVPCGFPSPANDELEELFDLNRDGVGDVPYRPLSLFAKLVDRVPAALLLLRQADAHPYASHRCRRCHLRQGGTPRSRTANADHPARGSGESSRRR